MIAKFNNIFYLLIFLVHFLGVGIYAFQTIVGTKSFMRKFNIAPTGAIMTRLAGGFMLAAFLMSIYVGFIRPNGLEGSWAFFNLVFVNNFCIFLCNFYSVKIDINVSDSELISLVYLCAKYRKCKKVKNQLSLQQKEII